MTAPEITLECAAPLVEPLDLEALETVLLRVLSDRSAEGSVTVVLTDDETLHRLNRDFRGKDRATDVISFDLRDSIHPGNHQVGEIYISLDRCRSQAREAGRPFHEEVAHLAIHGLLHLAGFEHETDDGHARMQEQEARYLTWLQA